VPFFNAAPYIRACLDSLLAQDFPDDAYEVLMVDNNSTDDSARIVGQYQRVH
jgi:glycosyltransferase involved in cell wall biosynthesis